VSALDLGHLRHQAKDQLQLQLKLPVMVLEEARVLLEEEVEEKKNLIQITLLKLLPVSDGGEVYQDL
jgi:translation initiation factor 2 gamma subunit (eIF-2gamma)